MSARANAINATIASQLTTLCIYPLDLAKTKFQASSAKSDVKYRSLLDVLQNVLDEQGVPGLYNGIGAELLQQALMQGCFFFCYQYFKGVARKMNPDDIYTVRIVFKMNSHDQSLQQRIRDDVTSMPMMGAISGCISDISNPNEISMTFQLPVKDSDLDSVQQQFNSQWKQALQDKIIIQSDTTKNEPERIPHPSVKSVTVGEKSDLSTAQTALAGLSAGCVTVFVMLPVSSVLTRMQTRSIEAPDTALGVAGTLKYLIATNGFGSLYRGLVPGLILTSNPTIVNLLFDKGKAKCLRGGNKTQLDASEAFLLACIAKFIATVLTYPYIISKTRLMTVDNKTGKPLYTSTGHVLATILKTEGPMGIYRGLLTQSFTSVLKMGLLLTFKERIPLYIALFKRFLVEKSMRS